MQTIEERFSAEFAQWGIRLLPDDVAKRQRGKIVKGGWAIWYLFGADKRSEYLDYYSAHRMTSDAHVRLYANGKTKDLPVILQMRLCSEDPEEDKNLEAKFLARTGGYKDSLKRKDLESRGMNRALVV